MKLRFDTTPFLETSELPWISYKINHEKGLKANELKKALISDKWVQKMIKECKEWPGTPIKRHNDANHILHKICLLIDFGLDINDKGIKDIVKKILGNQAGNGAFLSNLLIPKHFGGSGEPSLGWLLCDFPILLYILLSFKLNENKKVLRAIDFLKGLVSDNGWRCTGSLPKFRGPGRKSDHCPYATLVSLKAFSMLPEYYDEQFIKIGCDVIINQWKKRTERKIYMFAMGTDFKKLKYPNIWFDITHVTKVLSRFPYARKSNTLREMLGIIKGKQLESAGFIPESIYTAYKGLDFGQKKTPSPSLTYSIREIFAAFS